MTKNRKSDNLTVVLPSGQKRLPERKVSESMTDLKIFFTDRQKNQFLQIIRLDFHAVGGLVPMNITAFFASKSKNIALSGVWISPKRFHNSATVGGPIAGIYIQMQRTKAERTMISGAFA